MYPQTSRMGRVSRPLLRLHFKRASYSFIMRLFRSPHFTGLYAARDLHTVGVLGSVNTIGSPRSCPRRGPHRKARLGWRGLFG